MAADLQLSVFHIAILTYSLMTADTEAGGFPARAILGGFAGLAKPLPPGEAAEDRNGGLFSEDCDASVLPLRTVKCYRASIYFIPCD
ncbi:hypothetical protein [Rhizobium leguminosarum]|uniref:hypothetical protein n=1 Tax=Rhizobium leguminosarum TaxID=384 RepID=UPI0013DAFD29|nr:hypothetical protein [Rhizobium leguminosarum]NEK33260.1 hypothetical protein [Rhizobium leguminosarum]